MSFVFEDKESKNLSNAWVLSPYCFCKDRAWLSIDNLRYIDAGDGGEEGTDGGVTIGSLDPDATALLAALLTALAIFLFLLFLLLCLLCPWGLCCGKKGLCCSKASQEKKSVNKAAMAAPSVSSGNSVNLTAVDMKIPRPWTDNMAGLSDSELDGKGKHANTGWDDASVAGWWNSGKGAFNEGYQGDYFKDGGWFSSSDLDSIYGRSSVRERKAGWEGSVKKGHDMMAMEEFYRGFRSRANTGDRSNKSSVRRHRRNSYGDIVDRLMTPLAGTDSGGRIYDNESAVYSKRLTGNDGERRVVETMAVTKQETLSSGNGPVSILPNSGINALSEISFNDRQNAITLPASANENNAYSVVSPPSYTESHHSAVVASPAMNMAPNFARTDMTFPPNVIQEVTSSYKKRTVEETETTTTL